MMYRCINTAKYTLLLLNIHINTLLKLTTEVEDELVPLHTTATATGTAAMVSRHEELPGIEVGVDGGVRHDHILFSGAHWILLHKAS